MKSFNVAVVGASGAVGREVLETLTSRKFPLKRLRVFSSARSAGRKLEAGGQTVTLEALKDDESFAGLDIVFFTSGSSVSEKPAFRAAAAGALVIDNASIFRMRP